MKKKKILLVNEFSGLSTGYSTLGLELMKRLFATEKYELAELACYTTASDPRIKQFPWKIYPNHPERPDNEFLAKRGNEFGEYTFEKVCLDFRPDIVADVRDWWHCEFEERSPFRPYYRWIYMPTVDSSPQHEQWLATIMNADAVFTYSDWGTEILKKESGGLIKTRGSAPPGADLETFRPMDKGPLRKKFHFEDDVNIIGITARNQSRKLYPELLEAFASFLKQAPFEMARKTFLYLHTTYPDLGWDIPRLIKRNGLGSKTLVTYKCERCSAVFPSFFMDAVTPCLDCGQTTARMPNVQIGIDRDTLAKVMNLFDVYVQYASNEGFGMPMVEAASCGIPVFAVDYSAMSDVVRKVGGYPIKVQSMRLDSDLGSYRATPDNQDLVEKLIKYFSLPESQRRAKSRDARVGVEKNYTWDATVKKWMGAFDGMSAARSWDSPPHIHKPASIPSNSKFETNEDLVRWAIVNVLGRPDMTDSYLAVRLIRDLNWGATLKRLAGNYANEDSFQARRGDLEPFTASLMIKELTAMCEHRNQWEQRRCLMKPD